jgi:hypothetical protein
VWGTGESGKLLVQPIENHGDASVNVLLELMFPKPKGVDALGGKLPLHFAVPLPIAVDLSRPESLVCLWNMAALRTAVPKTSIHENGQSCRAEIEVGLTGNVFRVANPA